MSFGERTHNFDNEKIDHSWFAWYAEWNSSVDINPKSYHSTAFE